MRKTLLMLVLVGLILATLVTSVSCGTVKTSSSTTAVFNLETITTLAITETVDGKTLYNTNCASCHGVDFKGGNGPTLMGFSPEYAIGLIEYQILHGDALMPGFYGKLTNSEVAAIASYVLLKK